MNLLLKVDGFLEHLIYTKPINNGIQCVFRFENTYGASVVKHDFSYGHELDLWELAVIKFEDDNKWNEHWYLNYDTPITNDVIGWLTNEVVLNLLQQIKEL